MGYEDEWTTYKSFGFKSMPLCCKRILHLLHINYIAGHGLSEGDCIHLRVRSKSLIHKDISRRRYMLYAIN